MTVGEGQFLLYSYITPALKAGDYRFDVSQAMTAKKGTDPLDADELPIESLQTHVRVTAPRYQLPPDQVLSTFPPAGTEGAYGSRLPQVVIKRRTLPWERGLTIPDGHGGETPVDEKTPWLALVLIAEGEAEFRLNEDVADCVTPGVTLDGEPDVAKGNCLVVRQSVLERILPTRKDVPLLAHAREVDIHDTELMMGDDDGFLAVVISNRLPVAGVDADGNDVAVKYLACLINLEGQFHRLIPEAPPHRDTIQLFGDLRAAYVTPAVYDHVNSGELVEHWGRTAVNPAELLGPSGTLSDVPLGDAIDDADGGPAPHADPMARATSVVKSIGPGASAYTSTAGYATAHGHDVYEAMARDFTHATFVLAEPEFTFPVLLHWSFVSTGSVTFETLMRGLDSGLHGSVPESTKAPEGRPPLEVVETGHVGLTHRTRRGDTVRSWYRGPLLPHPSSGERLPIAHASDQLRSVIPDGREDISLAAAFEIGRLLALSRPAMVAALMRWRQADFQAARFESIWDQIKQRLPFEALSDDGDLRRQLEGRLRDVIVGDPDQLIGGYRSPVTPGDPVDWGGNPLTVMRQGFGIDLDLAHELRNAGDLAEVTSRLRSLEPAVVGSFEVDGQLAPGIVDHLHGSLDAVTEQLVSNVLANEITVDPNLGSGVIRTPDVGTVVVRPGDTGAILNIPGGILAGLGPHAEPPARPRRPRSSRARPHPSDPLDELLARGRGTDRERTPPEDDR